MRDMCVAGDSDFVRVEVEFGTHLATITMSPASVIDSRLSGFWAGMKCEHTLAIGNVPWDILWLRFGRCLRGNGCEAVGVLLRQLVALELREHHEK